MKSIVDFTNEIKNYFASKQALTTADQRITDTQSSIAPVETGTKYSKTYIQYERFIKDNKLYKVTTASVGTSDTITVGANCKLVSPVENFEYWQSTDWGVPICVTRNDRVCVLAGLYSTTTAALSANTAYAVGNLNESLRPSQNVYLSAVATNYSGEFKCYLRITIGQNGSISICPSVNVASGTTLLFSVTYISQ